MEEQVKDIATLAHSVASGREDSCEEVLPTLLSVSVRSRSRSVDSSVSSSSSAEPPSLATLIAQDLSMDPIEMQKASEATVQDSVAMVLSTPLARSRSPSEDSDASEFPSLAMLLAQHCQEEAA